MNTDHIASDLRHYRRQHREDIRWRNWWIGLMDGQRTFSSRMYEEAARQCRELARAKIKALREARHDH